TAGGLGNPGDRSVGVEAGVRMFAAPELDPIADVGGGQGFLGPSGGAGTGLHTIAAVGAAKGFFVRPGETVTGPWLLLGLFDGAMEDASHTLKDYLMEDRPREPSWAGKVLPGA